MIEADGGSLTLPALPKLTFPPPFQLISFANVKQYPSPPHPNTHFRKIEAEKVENLSMKRNPINLCAWY